MEKFLLVKSKTLGLMAIDIYRELKAIKEYVFADQILRSGTSIGANLHEAYQGVSKNDFIYRMFISLKEAKELEYWLELTDLADLLPNTDLSLIIESNQEVIRLLVSTLKTLRKNQSKRT